MIGKRHRLAHRSPAIVVQPQRELLQSLADKLPDLP